MAVDGARRRDRRSGRARPAPTVVLELPRGGKIRAQDAAVRAARGERRRLLATPTRCGSRTRCASSSRRSPTRASATSAARSTFTNEAGTNQEGLYWRYEMCAARAGVGAGVGHRRQRRDLRRAPRGLRRGRPDHGPRPLVPVPDGQGRLARASTQPERAGDARRWCPSIEGEWRAQAADDVPRLADRAQGRAADPRGYSPLYALMIVSHRLLRYGTPFLHVLDRARDARAAAPRPRLPARRGRPGRAGRRRVRRRPRRSPRSSPATTC